MSLTKKREKEEVQSNESISITYLDQVEELFQRLDLLILHTVRVVWELKYLNSFVYNLNNVNCDGFQCLPGIKKSKNLVSALFFSLMYVCWQNATKL